MLTVSWGGLSLKDYLKTQFFLTVNALEKPIFLLLLSLPRHIGNIFEWLGKEKHPTA